jgi:hypothetical protein
LTIKSVSLPRVRRTNTGRKQGKVRYAVAVSEIEA